MSLKKRFESIQDVDPKDIVSQVRQAANKAGGHVLDGATRLRDVGRADLKRGVKEARRQIGELSEYAERAQGRITELTRENEQLKTVSDELSSRLQQAEQQLKELRAQLPGVKKVEPAKPAAKKPATRKPATKKATAANKQQSYQEIILYHC
jgi:TolA-binding protein